MVDRADRMRETQAVEVRAPGHAARHGSLDVKAATVNEAREAPHVRAKLRASAKGRDTFVESTE